MRTRSSILLCRFMAAASVSSMLGCAGPTEFVASERPTAKEPTEPVSYDDREPVAAGPQLGLDPFAPTPPDGVDVCSDDVFVDGADLTGALSAQGAAHLTNLGIAPWMYETRRIDVAPCTDGTSRTCDHWMIWIDVAAIATASSASLSVHAETVVDPLQCETDACTGEATKCSGTPQGTSQIVRVGSAGAFVQRAHGGANDTLELSLPFLSESTQPLSEESAEARQALLEACQAQTGLVWDDDFYAGPPAGSDYELLGMLRANPLEPSVGCFYADFQGSFQSAHDTAWLFSLTTTATVGAPVAGEGAHVPACASDGFGLQPVNVPVPDMTTRYLDEQLAIDSGQEPTGCPTERIPAQHRLATCGVDEQMSAILIDADAADGFCARMKEAGWAQIAGAISEAVPSSRLIEIRDRAEDALAGVVLAAGMAEPRVSCGAEDACSLAEMAVALSPIAWTGVTSDAAGMTFSVEIDASP